MSNQYLVNYELIYGKPLEYKLTMWRDYYIHGWVGDEKQPVFKLRKGLHLLKHGKHLNDWIKSQINKFIKDACDEMLQDEYDFLKTQSIYTDLETRRMDCSSMKKSLDTTMEYGIDMEFYPHSRLGLDLCELLCVPRGGHGIGRGLTNPYICNLLCDLV